MTADDDNRELDRYLWDPAAEPSADVQAVERRLAPMRFDAARRPLILPGPTRSWRHQRALLALAAALVLVASGAAGFWSWRFRWPAGAPWPLTIERGTSPTAPASSQLRLNEALQLDPRASAEVAIARIGTMHVAPGSALTVSETTSRRHRVLLQRGAVSVRVWAPPAAFAFTTPAGSVIDLGCVFDLSVDPDGTSRLRVDTGWVEMANGWGESLVPAGASSIMTAAARPGVPVFDDAAPEFAAGVRTIERDADAAAHNGTLDAVLRAARPRDVLTLLTLTAVSPASARRPIVDRAAELWPPPSTVNASAVAGGDREQLWRWYRTLDLPPAKSWWLNWRDALPRFR